MRQNPHVRICGGPGSATTLVYPTERAEENKPPPVEPNTGVSGDAAGAQHTEAAVHEKTKRLSYAVSRPPPARW